MAEVQLEVREVTAVQASLRPRLELRAQFQPSGRELTIHEGTAEIALDLDQELYLTQAALDENGRKVRSNNPSEVTFYANLNREDLENIESRRGGGDLRFTFNGNIAGTNSNNEYEVSSFNTKSRIPQSDWADMLETFGYGEVRLIELRFPDPPAREYIEEAWDHIEDADQDFARGNWSDSATDARKAVNVIDRMRSDTDLETALGPEKWDRMSSLMNQLNQYLDLAAHSEQQIGHEPIQRRDAEAGLLMTKALVNFVADGIREQQE